MPLSIRLNSTATPVTAFLPARLSYAKDRQSEQQARPIYIDFDLGRTNMVLSGRERSPSAGAGAMPLGGVPTAQVVN
jgi:hypothetical protein